MVQGTSNMHSAPGSMPKDKKKRVFDLKENMTSKSKKLMI